MSYRYVLLGAGRQGVAAAYDLGRFGEADDILLCDLHLDVAASAAAKLNTLLGRPVAHAQMLDVFDTRAVGTVLKGADGAISGVHYTANLAVTRLAIEQKVHST